MAFGADALGGNYDFNPGRAVVRTITPDYIADLSVEMIDGSDKGKIYALQSKYTHRISRPEFGFRKLDPAIIRFFGDNEEQAKKNIMLEVNGSVTRILRKKEAEYNVASPNFWTHMDSTIKDRLLDELLDLYRTVVTPINFPSLRDTFTQALDIIIKKEVDKLQPEQPHDPYLNGRM
ncbi:MAG: hypothetical protein HY225_02085 [Candidatus Vogelbacteria bacterium]|nr:hypothetical protein [Candidatus Vogelbacteria bacterium]